MAATAQRRPQRHKDTTTTTTTKEQLSFFVNLLPPLFAVLASKRWCVWYAEWIIRSVGGWVGRSLSRLVICIFVVCCCVRCAVGLDVGRLVDVIWFSSNDGTVNDQRGQRRPDAGDGLTIRRIYIFSECQRRKKHQIRRCQHHAASQHAKSHCIQRRNRAS